MTGRVADISRLGQSTYRAIIQPQAVQSMISQIRPWEFPSRFQNSMMPNLIPVVSGPIKQRQMQFMQAGINNSSFPNVPLPSGGMYQPQNGSQQQQNPYYQPQKTQKSNGYQQKW